MAYSLKVFRIEKSPEIEPSGDFSSKPADCFALMLYLTNTFSTV
jgi:hypothetical protein